MYILDLPIVRNLGCTGFVRQIPTPTRQTEINVIVDRIKPVNVNSTHI